MNDCEFYVDDTAGISPMELRSKARRLKRGSGIDVIIVDYLQLMSIPKFSENRVNEIGEVTRALKALQKNLIFRLLHYLSLIGELSPDRIKDHFYQIYVNQVLSSKTLML